MVLGCTSGAGKSWLATALCRLYARRGYRVAPFKAQNMSNHARVVEVDGGAGEIGSAQYFQALAAGVPPDVRMNPVLLKPETDSRSQVVLLGRVREDLTHRAWRERADTLWQSAREAYESLRADFDLIVIEGAGSPAEINLAAQDFVNTRTAMLANASCLLVADIDRGGAFAHLLGTHQMMDEGVRRLLKGFVLNRFRGDATLLAPGPAQLQAMTGLPTVAVIRLMGDHGLPEEDAVPADSAAIRGPRVVVIAGPHASNLDEFEPLRAAGVRLSFARDVAAVAAANWLILPGSKLTRGDIAWLKERGLDLAIREHVVAHRPLLAICGGLQMLGERIEDPGGVEGAAPGTETGLAVLPLITRYGPRKQIARVRAQFGALSAPWAALSGLGVDGYEIHFGETCPVDPASADLRPALTASGTADTIGWQCGSVLGTYVHGLFENPSLVSALMGGASCLPGINFDAMADHVERSFVPGFLESLIDPVGQR